MLYPKQSIDRYSLLIVQVARSEVHVPLTPKQATFVREYMIDLNGTQAAIRAGSSRSSRWCGSSGRQLTVAAMTSTLGGPLTVEVRAETGWRVRAMGRK